MLLPLDGPAVYGNISVTDTPSEIKVGASVLEERKVVTIQPLDGIVYYGYDNTVDETSGTKVFKGQLIYLEASDKLPVWVVSEPLQTVDVRITEVS